MYKNTVCPESTLRKKHHSIAYHKCRESVACGKIRVAKQGTEKNLADVFTKLMSHARRQFLLDRFTYWWKQDEWQIDPLFICFYESIWGDRVNIHIVVVVLRLRVQYYLILLPDLLLDLKSFPFPSFLRTSSYMIVVHEWERAGSEYRCQNIGVRILVSAGQ